MATDHLDEQLGSGTNEFGMPELISLTDAARHLKVSYTSVWRLCQRGDLPLIRIGPTAVRTTVSAVVAYVSDQLPRRA